MGKIESFKLGSKVCNGVSDCPSGFDEENCGCDGITKPVEVIILLDMSLHTWRIGSSAPKQYRDFAKKLIERFSVTNKKKSPHIGVFMYGDKKALVHTGHVDKGNYGFMPNVRHSKAKVLAKVKSLKYPKPKNGWTKAMPWTAAEKATKLFKTRGSKRMLVHVMSKNADKTFTEKRKKKFFSKMLLKNIKYMSIHLEEKSYHDFQNHDPVGLNFNFDRPDALLAQDYIDDFVADICEALEDKTEKIAQLKTAEVLEV